MTFGRRETKQERESGDLGASADQILDDPPLPGDSFKEKPGGCRRNEDGGLAHGCEPGCCLRIAELIDHGVHFSELVLEPLRVIARVAETG
jgi:hypothetical protein